jgi:hypothetical protein
MKTVLGGAIRVLIYITFIVIGVSFRLLMKSLLSSQVEVAMGVVVVVGFGGLLVWFLLRAKKLS